MIDVASVEALGERIDQEVAVSDWLHVTQAKIDQFAEATGDRQWIHVDTERAAGSPFKGTIAHGFLTLSLVSVLAQEALRIMGLRMAINYGLNRVRFTNAVPAGARVRGRAKIVAVEDFRGGLQLTEEITIEIDGQSRPACVAETIARLYF